MAALFDGLQETGRYALLDLGASDENNFRLFSRYARWIRFGDLLANPPRGGALKEALQTLQPPPRRAFDLVLAWNLLDFLGPEERKALMDRLTHLTTPQARLYVVVAEGNPGMARPLRFSLLGPDRVRQTTIGTPMPMGPQLLPAEVERLMDPFEVVHAFTLRLGMREYVGFRKGGVPRGPSWRFGNRRRDPEHPPPALP